MNFLKHILGEIGAKAIDRVSESAPLLRPVIIPRAVLAWVEIQGKLGYDGEIPGVENSYLSLKKTQEEYTGAITIGPHLYVFEKSDLLNVAASLGVALNLDVGQLDERLKRKDLTNFGKSIDLLVKSEVIKKLKKLKKEDISGGPAPHQEAIKPSKGDLPRIPNRIQSPSQQKPNVTPPQGVKVKIDKAEAEKKCDDCGKKLIKDDKFDGCDCLQAEASNVEIKKTEDGYVLHFSPKMDIDAISAICEILKD